MASAAKPPTQRRAVPGVWPVVVPQLSPFGRGRHRAGRHGTRHGASGGAGEGKVDVPGGFLEVEGSPVLLAAHTYTPEAWLLARGFRARIVRGEPRPADDDVAGARWISAGEVDGTDFT